MLTNFTNLLAIKIYLNTIKLKIIKTINSTGLQDTLEEPDKMSCGLGSLALGTLELKDLLASENKNLVACTNRILPRHLACR